MENVLRKPFLLICMILLLLIFNTVSAYSWDNCPFGLEDDPYPGECNRYVDSDGDGICDLSQPAPEDRENFISLNLDIINENTNEQHEEEFSVEIEGTELKKMRIMDIASLWNIKADDLLNEIVNKYNLENNYNINNSINDLRQEYKFSPSQIKEIAENIKLINSSHEIKYTPELTLKAEAATSDISVEPSSKKAFLPDYNFLEIFFITLFIYFGGKFWARKLKITLPREKKFWNILLLISFIGSAGTGMILVFIRDFEWFKSINFNFLYWHVEFSILMTLIGIFHALWHLKYYLSIFKQYKKLKK